ncbi:hypothetical protein MERGE_000098 [Pneumocystis wakefieldiae]|uniref:triacylglycerol lipase n=1 Tax=Pneumocystis wakefieldiae TaxID=38082 RepID=A0A899FPE0_9ASCO|nr:hypothetical protein MERGE_000098 [Pneumocystis wakefieldiae]
MDMIKKRFSSLHHNVNSSIFFDWDLVDVDIPNIEDKETVINMAEIASNAYIEIPNTGDWEDVGGGLDVIDDDSWNKTALHGHVFIDDQNKTVIIALKGTSPELFGVYNPSTGMNDKINVYFKYNFESLRNSG